MAAEVRARLWSVSPGGDDGLMPGDAETKKHRSRWVWVSAVLAVAAVGLLVWALTVKSDLNGTEDDLASASQQLSSTKQELDSTSKELDKSQQQVEELESAETSDRRRRVGGALLSAGGLAAAKAVYDDLAEQLGATEEELDATQEDVEAANKAAADAAGDAEAAKREAAEADTEADKAAAETAQAKAEAKAEKTKSTAVADCVKAYVSAFGGLFEGDSIREQTESVRKDFATVSEDCKGTLEGA